MQKEDRLFFTKSLKSYAFYMELIGELSVLKIMANMANSEREVSSIYLLAEIIDAI